MVAVSQDWYIQLAGPCPNGSRFSVCILSDLLHDVFLMSFAAHDVLGCPERRGCS